MLEDRNEMLAHIKKYIIGKAADCDGNVGINQDAANNIYLMRLADVYLTYVEAKMATASSTSDASAMKYYNMVRQRAGVSEANSVTYEELLKERRRELAFESRTWFDTQRYRYREGDPAALSCSTADMARALTALRCLSPIIPNIPISMPPMRIMPMYIRLWIRKPTAHSMTIS